MDSMSLSKTWKTERELRLWGGRKGFYLGQFKVFVEKQEVLYITVEYMDPREMVRTKGKDLGSQRGSFHGN